MSYASLTEFLEAKKEQFLSQCLICGKCLRICPAIAVTGADFFASICGFCHLTFAPYQGQYPFQIGNLIDLVGESLGIKYEDKLKKYWLWKDIDRIMKDATETIQESFFTKEEVRSMLPFVFS